GVSQGFSAHPAGKPRKRLDLWTRRGTALKRGVNKNTEIGSRPGNCDSQLAARFQPSDRFAHHAMAEMALANAQQFRAMPFSLDCRDLLSRRDRIEFAGHEKNA